MMKQSLLCSFVLVENILLVRIHAVFGQSRQAKTRRRLALFERVRETLNRSSKFKMMSKIGALYAFRQTNASINRFENI